MEPSKRKLKKKAKKDGETAAKRAKRAALRTVDAVIDAVVNSGFTTIKAVLIDLSGILYVEDTVVEGSVDALRRLRASGVIIRFVINTSLESRRVIHRRLTCMGFELGLEEIYTSLNSARTLVDHMNVRPLLILEDEVLEDFRGVPVDEPNAVVIGLAPSKFDNKTMAQALRLILKGGPLIAIQKTPYQCSDRLSLGPGFFINGFETFTDTKAILVGKPESQFFLNCLKDIECRPEEAIMISDDARNDVLGAQLVGLKGILVKSGKYRRGDESKYQPPPDHVMPNFSAAVQLFLTNKNRE